MVPFGQIGLIEDVWEEMERKGAGVSSPGMIPFHVLN